ncbi:MAG: DNA topoisomerase (ATP-hydrolyzing) subunit B [Firmicutes bacterium]|nr:DNA topoisomerase (ATP-hydrolyzing) subunit B [Bacillota bacterium]
MSTKVTQKYGQDQIQVLEGLDPVRKRPGMYIGSTCLKGLHHLITEVVDNSIDEALAGHCDSVFITINKNGSVTVEDNGRGIPTEIHKKEKVSAVEVVLTKLHAGGKFGGGGYKVSGGLHGVGISVVNALSEWLEVEVFRDGNHHKQVYNRGIPQRALQVIGKAKKSGTKITFMPDSDIFESTIFVYENLRTRLRELAFLNSGVTIIVEDKRVGKEQKESFKFEGGIIEFVNYLNRSKDQLFFEQPLYILQRAGTKDKPVEIEVAMQYNDSYNEVIFAYANNINTEEGGTHLEGFKNSLTKVVNDYAKKYGLIKDNKENLSGEDVREGLTAVISVKLTNPQFEGQTKTKLSNSDMRTLMARAINELVGSFLEENPKIGRELIMKCLTAQRAREAARNARELTKRKSVFESTTLPGKLSDCTEKDPRLCEIYLVEGDSAGGTAKQGRDRRFQAILPLRGKIINVEKARLGKVLENEEIKAMITAFGAGVGDDFDISKLRYDRIIIMTDADVDGSHIRILLLTFFFRYMRPLIEGGHVYIARPPLYKVTKSRQDTYLFSDKELEQHLDKVGRQGTTIQRYKGLGEMNADQLWSTTMNPEYRTLLKVTMDDAFEAEETFSMLMGERPELRREFIEQNAKSRTLQDLEI